MCPGCVASFSRASWRASRPAWAAVMPALLPVLKKASIPLWRKLFIIDCIVVCYRLSGKPSWGVDCLARHSRRVRFVVWVAGCALLLPPYGTPIGYDIAQAEIWQRHAAILSG
ncbi:hypothetical protein AzCIB_4682 [Azoarcus sp. CIB]|nr:hypothetical protein AzCIB_4682 [Azoarcus sp. CIB]